MGREDSAGGELGDGDVVVVGEQATRVVASQEALQMPAGEPVLGSRFSDR
jgi:hypothetical protein